MKNLLFLSLTVFLFCGCQSPKIVSLRSQPIVSQTPVKTNTVAIENGKFIPDQIQVSLGENITINNQDKAIWTIISDPHPDHNQNSDLYKILYAKESYQYQFALTGSFGVHLEENPSVNLKIVVE